MLVIDTRTWVRFQRLNKEVFEFDDQPAQWEDVYTLRVSIVPTGGKEVIDGQKVAAQITHIVYMRWMPFIHPHWRIVVEDGAKIKDDDRRIFHIDNIENHNDDDRDLVLQCIESRREDTDTDLRGHTGGIDTSGVLPDCNWIWQADANSCVPFQSDDHIWQDGCIATWFQCE